MSIRHLRADCGGSPPYEQMGDVNYRFPAIELDDETGQMYAAEQPIGVIVGLAARVAQATLSPSDVLNLKAKPYVVVPAPGVGFVVMLLFALLQYKFVTTPYGNTGANDLAFCWDAAGISSPFEAFSSNGFLNQTQSHITQVPVSIVGAHRDVAENQPVVLTHAGGSTEFSSGDGLLLVSAVYRVIQLA